MDKRLTRTDYAFAIMTIFMIVCVIGAFFVGFDMGAERTETRYQKMMAVETAPPEEPGAYAQQTLVSFYHNMYLPFREFQVAWFDAMEKIETSTDEATRTEEAKKLASLANDAHARFMNKSMPVNSPMLAEAQSLFTSSLESFAAGLQTMSGKAGNMTGPEFGGALQLDANIAAAKKAALQGQRNFYASMVKWYQTIDPQIQPTPPDKAWNVQDWSQAPLLVKNQYAAERMLADLTFRSYLPQDLTARIDDLIATGQASKLNLTDVPAVIQLLNGTEAVRSGDYFTKANNRYANDVLPDLPLFTK